MSVRDPFCMWFATKFNKHSSYQRRADWSRWSCERWEVTCYKLALKATTVTVFTLQQIIFNHSEFRVEWSPYPNLRFCPQVSSTPTSACRAPSPPWPSASWRSTRCGTTARRWPSPNSGPPRRLPTPPRGPPGWPVTLSRLPWLRMVIM